MNRKLGTKVTWAVYTLPGPVSSATRPIGAVQMTNPAARMCTVRGVEGARWCRASSAINGGGPASSPVRPPPLVRPGMRRAASQPITSGGDDDRERHGEHGEREEGCDREPDQQRLG